MDCFNRCVWSLDTIIWILIGAAAGALIGLLIGLFGPCLAAGGVIMVVGGGPAGPFFSRPYRWISRGRCWRTPSPGGAPRGGSGNSDRPISGFPA